MSAELNYYQILGIPANANKIQICQAYKALALQYHPDLKHENINKSYKKFCLISEAFDILYDGTNMMDVDQKRRVFDAHGEQVLKEGLVDDQGERKLGNYTFTTEPEAIFEKFFGSRNVFEHLLTVGEGQGRSHPVFSTQYDADGSKVNAKSVDNLVVKIECGLSQLFNGCKKTLTYDKKILCPDRQTIQTVQQTKTIDILPGSSCKCPIVFKDQGHQEPGQKNSDLLFQIIEIPQMGFKRDKNDPQDLIYTADISLMDALDSKSIQIKQLNGQIIQLHFDQIISPQTQRNIDGKGMPVYAQKDKRGNLLVKFNIMFPQQIPIQRKERIVELLKSAQNQI